MTADTITPDQVILWQLGPVTLNSTICYTWVVMALLTMGSWLVTRRLSSGPHLSRWQNLLEIIVSFVRDQIHEISHRKPGRYVPFVGTLFLFIAISNFLDVVPGFHAPTASLSTTVALAVCVLFAVPVYGIGEKGVWNYLKHYVKPSVFMLPFNILGEVSRTLALAVRLFGNIMSGAKVAAILLAVAPLFFPVVMHALGLLTGLIQAYIFAILTMVYIASAGHANDESRITDARKGLERGKKLNG